MADLPGEEINLDDLDYDEDEYESTVGDELAVGGTPAETDFGGQIRTPADRSSVRRRGSVEWETDRDVNISSETQNSIKDLNERLDLLKQHADSDSPSLKDTIRTLQRQKAELARDAFRDYVLEEYGLTQQGTAFVTEASYRVDDSG